MQNRKLKNLTNTELVYIAGFLDGNGSILAQIVKGRNYKYKFTVRLSINFYEKKSKHWFFIQLYNKIGVGHLRIKKDGMAEYSILGINPIEKFLKPLLPFLILKKHLAVLIFQIINGLRSVKTEADFIEVCKLIDKTADYTYSKVRKNNSLVVQNTLNIACRD